jgi:YtfJ family uncharacterized protein
MSWQKPLIGTLLLAWAATVFAQPPAPESPLPPLVIEDRGELVMENDSFSYAPWSAAANPGKVHIVQYFGATRGDSKLFEGFTDRLRETFEHDQYHVTTIINLDAALWGTSGLVVSEVQDSKRKYPNATMVLDEEGTGVKQWQLGKGGTGLAILDAKGIVHYFTRKGMNEQEISSSVALVKEQIDACLKFC